MKDTFAETGALRDGFHQIDDDKWSQHEYNHDQGNDDLLHNEITADMDEFLKPHADEAEQEIEEGVDQKRKQEVNQICEIAGKRGCNLKCEGLPFRCGDFPFRNS